MSATSELISDEELKRISDAGQTIYDERLKALMEPQENGRMVVIHLDTGDHAVEDTYPRALRSLRKPTPPE